MTTLATYPPPAALGTTQNPGGAGALAVVIGVPVVLGGIGALVGGPKHRILGAFLGIGAGLLGVKLMASGGKVPVTPSTP